MDKIEIQKISEQALKAHEKEDYAKAEKLFLEALYLLDDKANPLYQRLVYGLGINYALQENYEGAKSCFQEGRFNAIKAQNMEFELQMIHELIVVCRKAEEYQTAELLVEEEILYRKTHTPDDLIGLVTAYYEGAMTFLSSLHFKRSNLYLKEALVQAKNIPDDRYTAWIYMGMGDLYFAQNENDLAKKAYQKSLAIYEKYENKKISNILCLRLRQTEL
ncbi:tetratricopeptide repeat protein [Jeotgalibaca sp. MA1X17-3]|uniref:tetratricopeptide repeat protein n=1 Tax=Jeotgalibaca sp. MA1X17-3 TaxID=2908211 RepID=UPI001F2B900F|nr:tetratricopeptide repeat protein [Jeotgalibaca sp. MA1X17-3]UJF16402.1 tetratricopeptide repeat protein [Jeotgalibaca sp. MA1X17-3]